MRTRLGLALLALGLAGVTRADPAPADPAEQFQQGLYLERTVGDIVAALASYDRALGAARGELAVRVQLRRAELLAGLTHAEEARSAIEALRRLTAEADARLGPARFFPKGIDLVLGLDTSSLRLAPLLARVAPEASRWITEAMGFDPLVNTERLFLGVDFRATEADPVQWVAAVEFRVGEAPETSAPGTVWLDERTLLTGDPQTRQLAREASQGRALGLRANLALSRLLSRLPDDTPLWLAATRLPGSMLPGAMCLDGLLVAGRLEEDLRLTAMAWTPDRERARCAAEAARSAIASGYWPPGARLLVEPAVEIDGATAVLTARLPSKLINGATSALSYGRTDLIGEGLVDRERIARRARSQRRGIESCLEAALARRWDLKGEVVVQFTISNKGTVTKAAVVERGVPSLRLIQCLLRRVENWRFAPPEGGEVVVSQSFLFGRKR